MWRSLNRFAVRCAARVASTPTRVAFRTVTLRRVFPATAGFGLAGLTLAALEGKAKPAKTGDTKTKASAEKPADKATEQPAAPKTSAAAPAAAAAATAAAAAAPKTFPSDPSDPGYEMRLRILDRLGNHCPCWEKDMKGPCAEAEFRCVTCMDQAMTLCSNDELKQMRDIRDKLNARRKAKTPKPTKPASDATTAGATTAAAKSDGEAEDDLSPPSEEDFASLSEEERAIIKGPNCMDLTEFVIFTNCTKACQATDQCRKANPEYYPDGKPPSQQQPKSDDTPSKAHEVAAAFEASAETELAAKKGANKKGGAADKKATKASA